MKIEKNGRDSMTINVNLIERINEFDDDIRELALELLTEIEKDRKSSSQLEEILLEEIDELIGEA